MLVLPRRATRVGVVHGDAESLAGWRFDIDALDDPKEQAWRAEAFAKAEVDIFASTHTCLPAMRRFDLDGEKLVANNGAAGMPNARGSRFGILTRIGTDPLPGRACMACTSMRMQPHDDPAGGILFSRTDQRTLCQSS
jgi:hypothetical protein